MIDIKLYATRETELLTSDGTIVSLPSGYTVFGVECQMLKRDEQSDILVVRKQASLPTGTYSSESRFSSAHLLDALPSSICMTHASFTATPGLKENELLPLVNGITLFEDSRDDLFFPLQREPGGPLALCRLRQKYYSATLDVNVRVGRTGNLRQIYGVLHTNVTLCSPDDDTLVEPGTPIYFAIPQEVILWNNTAVTAVEDGQEYWAHNGVPLIERWQKD